MRPTAAASGGDPTAAFFPKRARRATGWAFAVAVAVAAMPTLVSGVAIRTRPTVLAAAVEDATGERRVSATVAAEGDMPCALFV